MATTRRLPGISIDVTPPPPGDVLPRMDIAVFVGFALAGPVHRPVAVEHVAQFLAIFGADAPLAWDAEHGERSYANLGPAVRAFFSNGGQRCWVIRVARTFGLEALWRGVDPRTLGSADIAVANEFPLPGVLAAYPDGTSAYLSVTTPAVVQARSLGAWSDDLRVATAATSAGFLLEGWQLRDSSAGLPRISFHTSSRLRAGDLVLLDDPSGQDAVRTYARVDKVVTGASAVNASGQIDATLCAAFVRTAGGGATAWQNRAISHVLQALHHSPPTRGSVLALELQVADGQGAHWHLTGIGLTPSHPAAWWQQLSDDIHYATASGVESGERFPLAARDAEQGGAAPLAFIPLEVGAAFGMAAAPISQGFSALERDGLSRFDAELFLDPGLADQHSCSLLEQADLIRYQSDTPRALYGAHAALSIGSQGIFNEASLLALPDALHPGWTRRVDQPIAPVLPQSAQAPGYWFAHRGPCAPGSGNQAIAAPDFGNFLNCTTHLLPPPLLRGPAAPVPLGPFMLTWTWAGSDNPVEYVLSAAVQRDLSDAREIYRGSAPRFEVLAPREATFYYVVTARAGDQSSAASNPWAVVVRADAWELGTAKTYAASGETELLSIHRAVLRLAAASGELFAVLGLPRHYRAPEAQTYALRLRTVQMPNELGTSLGYDEARALSYGALYHPWIDFGAPAGRSGASANASNGQAAAYAVRRACPPDGITSGVLAARSIARGAWIAPANEAFRDVVALTPSIGADAWADLQDAQVNLVRADSRGFLVLSADTLANDIDVRPINVRRLLILLRRLALREGASYVFEPNGDTLRRSVSRSFSLLLDNLFRRGAFAGATAAESFKVVTDDSLNTPTLRDAGRFLVELRVAPALPLQFLTLRLVQAGERFTLAEAL